MVNLDGEITQLHITLGEVPRRNRTPRGENVRWNTTPGGENVRWNTTPGIPGRIFNPYSAGIDLLRKILTSKVDSRAVRIQNVYIAVDP